MAWGTFNIDGASYDSKSYGMGAQIDRFTLSSDGLHAYGAHYLEHKIYQFDLSTAWDISTASVSGKSFSHTSQFNNYVSAMVLSTDGTKLYLLDDTNAYFIYQYTLSTAFDLSTCSYASKSFNIGDVGRGFYIKSDGTKMYVQNNTTYSIKQYTLSTAWDISTASYDSKEFDDNSYPFSLNDAGTKLYAAYCPSDKYIRQYTLSTAFDISTASYDSKTYNYSAVVGTTALAALFFKPDDGAKMYLMGNSGGVIYQYTTYIPSTGTSKFFQLF